ncbi:lysM and putative peptidoglycan-binding domain-containing protein 1 [Nelusetta ayraudi]|uniref:lysM and putative peptidoglycan-binding domain-containing protein 1 n=1 Tax=Nelusetta ayraudi TaxID=303726 RepID=UPI003F705DA5
MSGEEAPQLNGASGLLRASRNKSYGSLVRSQLSPVRQRRVEHRIQPGETLQGLALKYGVTMEQIKRANKMYTNDSIFLKKSLSIPVLSDFDQAHSRAEAEDSVGIPVEGRAKASDLSPMEFLKRLDGLIDESKQAAIGSQREAERRVAALEAACSSSRSEWRPLTRSQSAVSSSKTLQQQQVALATAPVAVTKQSKKLRDREDEIFQL